MARAGLALGGVVMIGVGAAIAFGWAWPSTAGATGTVRDQVTGVQLDNDSGDVTITVADVRETTVRQTFHYRLGKPGQSYELEGGELRLSGCGWWCSVDYEVVVPRGTAVAGELSSGNLTLEGVGSADVTGSSGDVRVHGVDGPVRVDVSSGSVELADIGADVVVKTSSGGITGTGLRGDVEAEASSGSIRLGLDEPADARVEASSGDVELTVPPGRYQVLGETNSGGRDIGVVQDPAASHRLDLNTSSGSVTVNG